MKIFEYGNEQSNLILIQMVDSHEIKMMDTEIELIRNLSGRDGKGVRVGDKRKRFRQERIDA